jgi:hypothetical protein
MPFPGFGRRLSNGNANHSTLKAIHRNHARLHEEKIFSVCMNVSFYTRQTFALWGFDHLVAF